MKRIAMLLPCLALSAAAAAAPILVTSSSGGVSLTSNGETTTAPGVPFLVPDGSGLKLADGAQIVVMIAGTAKRWTGPATLGDKALVPNATGAERGGSQLAAMISRQDTLSVPGATRDGVLQRPINRDTLLNLGEIRWRCPEPCTPVSVTVEGIVSGTTWTGTGAGAVTYAGPALEAGPYTLDVGGRAYTFTVADDATRSTITAARDEARTQSLALEGASKADQAALVAGVMFALGYPTEGLAELDAAGTEAAAVRAKYETFAHVGEAEASEQ